jgi:hypothetical protein
MRMAVTGNDPHTSTINSAAWNICPVLNGQTWVVSVYVKASVATTGELFIFGANSSGVGFVSGSWIGITSKTVNITTEWTRVDHFITYNNASVAFLQFRLDGPNSGGSGQTIWWDGLQVERASSATTFKPKINTNGLNWWDLTSSTVATLGNSPTYTPGKITFDGINQIATIPFESKFNFNTGQTIGVWLKPTEADTNRRNFYNQAYGGGGTITHEPNGGMNYYWGTAGTNTLPYDAIGSGFTVAQNELAYVTLTRDPHRVSWYKNGILTNSATNQYGAGVVTGTQNILIGFGYAGAFQGDVHSVHLYTRALSAQEVQQNFNASRSRFGL